MMRSDDVRWPLAAGFAFALALSAVIWGGAYLLASWLIGEWA